MEKKFDQNKHLFKSAHTNFVQNLKNSKKEQFFGFQEVVYKSLAKFTFKERFRFVYLSDDKPKNI
jgi:lysine/ornithine N-monooxygenase